MATGLLGANVAGYRIEGVAGRGGMGVVYRAREIALDRVVALKVIAPEHAKDPKFRSRFMRESLATAGVDHPNVIPVYDAGEGDDGQLFIAMRYVEGRDLGSLLHEKGALDPALAAELIAQAASALDAAHARGLVHRDVKPANVLIDGGERPHVYLTDFGLAKWEDSTSGLTSTGGWIGTPDYVAPEQVDGTTPDARTDVYALGCVLYAALTGRPPFADVPRLRKATAHLHEQPPPLRDFAPKVPKELEPVLRKALAKEPSQRYASAGELGRAALAAVSGERGRRDRTERTRRQRKAPPVSTPQARTARIEGQRQRPPRRTGRIAAVLLALALAGVAAAVVLGSFSSGGGDGASTTHHRAHHRKIIPLPTAAAGTVRCTSSHCTQAGKQVQAPIEDGTCGGGIGSWLRIDASAPPLIACVPNDPPLTPPATITVPDVLGGRVDLVHQYLDNLGIQHDTAGGGLLGILDESNWEVCASSPPAGGTIRADQTLKLFASHSC